MNHKERLRNEIFAWNTLEKAPYAVLAMADLDGKPYCIPVTPGADRLHGYIYIHCAESGLKLELIKSNPKVCLTAVSKAQSVPREFEMAYESAVFSGYVEEVDNRTEKIKGLHIIAERYDPTGMDRFNEVISRLVDATCVLKIVTEEITGKEACYPQV